MVVDLDKLNFYGKVNYLKRSDSCGSTTATVGGAAVTIAHDLGYIPFFGVYCDFDNDGIIWAGEKVDELTESSSGSSPTNVILTTWITTTDLSMTLSNGTGTRNLYYLIYYDYGSV